MSVRKRFLEKKSGNAPIFLWSYLNILFEKLLESITFSVGGVKTPIFCRDFLCNSLKNKKFIRIP